MVGRGEVRFGFSGEKFFEVLFGSEVWPGEVGLCLVRHGEAR